MLNHEGSHPEYFEELSALAAGGQISAAEFVELQGHLEMCAHCRSVYADFMDLLHNKLPLVDPELTSLSKRSGFFSESSSYGERFLTRARKEGFSVSQKPSRDTVRSNWPGGFWSGLGYPKLATLTVAVLLVTVGLLGYILRQTNARYRKLASEQAALSKQLS